MTDFVKWIRRLVGYPDPWDDTGYSVARRLTDAICDRLDAGEPPRAVARDYGLRVVHLISALRERARLWELAADHIATWAYTEEGYFLGCSQRDVDALADMVTGKRPVNEWGSLDDEEGTA